VSDDEPMTGEGMAAMRFLGDHGQSLDWVFMGDTTGMICALAAHAKQAARCIAVADPIFAVIEAHRTACDLFTAAVDENSRLEDELPADRQCWQWRVFDREPPANCADDPRWIANELECGRASVAMENAANHMARVKLQTLSGAAALLSYVAERCDRWELPETLADDDGTQLPFVFFVLKSALAAIGGAA
jgi:hypothetical protein